MDDVCLRTCIEQATEKCFWCHHKIYISVHNQINYYDIKEQKQLRFCSNDCKCLLLEDRVQEYYNIIEDLYDKVKPFVELDSNSD